MKGARTPKRNHENPSALPSPSDGESASGALGSSRHTRSSAIPRDCISASTPSSWHDARAGAGGSVLESAAPAALERCVNSTDASGPASVHMCYSPDSKFASSEISETVYLVLELNPVRERARCRVVVFHVLCRS